MARVLLSYVNSFMDNLVPIGTSLLSACLKREGHQVELFDTTFYRTREKPGNKIRAENLQFNEVKLEEYGVREEQMNVVDAFREKIDAFSPDLIGLSVVESTAKIAYDMLEGIRNYSIPKIVGGVHVTMCPEEALRDFSTDMICVGEGEEAIVDLASKLGQGADYSHVRNIWSNQNGGIRRNPLRPLVNLDDLPMQDWSIYEKERFLKPMGIKAWISGPIELDRGCAYKCSFCCNEKLHEIYEQEGKYTRKRSVEGFIKELKEKKEEYGLEYLYLVSENFLAMSRERFEEFVSLYGEIQLPFWIETRPETVKKDRLKKLEDIGCEGVSIGVEHGNDQFRRDILNRHVKDEVIKRAFEFARDTGIRSCANNIIGFPTETRELVFDTIELNRELNPDNIITNIFIPYRGTRLRDLSVEMGYISPTILAGDYRSDVELDMPQLTEEQVKGLRRTFPLYIKFPKSRWPLIEKAERFDDEGNKIFKELGDEYKETYL